MSKLVDYVRQYPHWFNFSNLEYNVLYKAVACESSDACENCILSAKDFDGACLAYRDDNPDLDSDIVALRESNPELFI